MLLQYFSVGWSTHGVGGSECAKSMGALADFVILDRGLRNMPEKELKHLKVLST